MRQKSLYLLMSIILIVIGLQAQLTLAQNATPAPQPLPNALLIYDQTTIALINTSSSPISIVGLNFIRAGGDVKFNPDTMVPRLDPGHCIQVWISSVRRIIGEPPECAKRDRYLQLARKESYFWVADSDNETFRPRLRSNALTICPIPRTEVGRCAFYIPQGDEASKPILLLDQTTKQPMATGMQVAYDANQIWIGNFIPDTVLPSKGLTIFYSMNGQPKSWTPAAGNWDIGKWDDRGLQNGQCIVLYQDAAKVTPLLPCIPVGKASVADPIWRVKFDVQGPREGKKATCGSDQPQAGPVLCLLPG